MADTETNAAIASIPEFVGFEVSEVTLIAVWLGGFFVAARLLGTGPKDDLGRKHLASFAETYGARLGAWYEASVYWLLSLVDKLSRDRYLERSRSGPSRGLDRTGYPLPWSNGLYDLTLRLAVAYPFLFAFGFWVWSGQTAPGLELLLPEGVENWHRVLVGCGLVAVVFSVLKLNAASGRRKLFYVSLFVVSDLVLAFAFEKAGAAVDAVAFAVGFKYLVKKDKTKYFTAFYIIHLILFTGLTMAVIYFLAPRLFDISSLLLIVFLVILPFSNAPLDWVSLGLTRGLVWRAGGHGESRQFPRSTS